MLYNSPTFNSYRPDQLRMCWDFLYEPDVRNVFYGTHRRLGKSHVVAELMFLLTFDAVGALSLGSGKFDALKARQAKLSRKFAIALALPSYEQISGIYRRGSLPAAAQRFKEIYPHVEVEVPLSGDLLRVTHNGKSAHVWGAGLEPRSIELRRGWGADILMIDEVASADFSRIEQVLMPSLKDSMGWMLVVGSAQALARKKGAHTEIAGFSRVRKHFQTTPGHVYRRVTIDDSTDDDGAPLLDRAAILEEHGWDEDHPVWQQEFLVNDAIVPEQGLFRLWNRWQDDPHDLGEAGIRYAVSVDVGFRDAYAVIVYAYADGHDKANVVFFKEYEQLRTEQILSDLYVYLESINCRKLDWLYLPHDSAQRRSTTEKTELGIWGDWKLSPEKRRIYAQLRNTEPNIRRCLNVINKVRVDISDREQSELFEERVKNATFALGQAETIYHDRHSHMAHAVMYGVQGMLLSGVLKDPEQPKPKPEPISAEEHRRRAFERALET